MNWLLFHYVMVFVFCYSFWVRYTLSATSMTTLLSFGFHCHIISFFHFFTLSLCVFLKLKWVSSRQHVVRSCFLTHSATVCLLMRELNPFTFRVIIVGKGLLSPSYSLFFGSCFFLLAFLPPFVNCFYSHLFTFCVSTVDLAL